MSAGDVEDYVALESCEVGAEDCVVRVVVVVAIWVVVVIIIVIVVVAVVAFVGFALVLSSTLRDSSGFSCAAHHFGVYCLTLWFREDSCRLSKLGHSGAASCSAERIWSRFFRDIVTHEAGACGHIVQIVLELGFVAVSGHDEVFSCYFGGAFCADMASLLV